MVLLSPAVISTVFPDVTAASHILVGTLVVATGLPRHLPPSPNPAATVLPRQAPLLPSPHYCHGFAETFAAEPTFSSHGCRAHLIATFLPRPLLQSTHPATMVLPSPHHCHSFAEVFAAEPASSSHGSAEPASLLQNCREICCRARVQQLRFCRARLLATVLPIPLLQSPHPAVTVLPSPSHCHGFAETFAAEPASSSQASFPSG